jgi:Cdc6-like AAA superfamily ATPase
MWESLGFKASPYDARPLKPIPEDAELLVGRADESTRFCTILESADEGIIVLSGPPGVGKTSFFNVQQYLLASELSPYGPKLLVTEQLCTIYPGDEPRAIALRAVESLVRSVEAECAAIGKPVPTQTATIARWVKSRTRSSFDIGLQIASIGGSFGRSVTLPSVTDVSFEGLQDAINAIVGEVVTQLGYEGVFLALDNIENLEDQELADVLITLRDTLFMAPRVWWILIGQSGLGSLIQSLDPRVADRITGSALELRPLTFEQLEEAIARRVSRFNAIPGAKSPLPESIHKLLYDASNGEIRFVFRYSHNICTHFVTWIRQVAMKAFPTERDPESFATKVASNLVNSQIPQSSAEGCLLGIIKDEFEGLSLRPNERKVLRLIAEHGDARPKDHEKFGLKSTQDFYSNYLRKLHSQHLLARRQEGKAVYYSLRGVAKLAYDLGLLNDTTSKPTSVS